MRFLELFEMVRDFPDSTPALVDLREALDHTHMHSDMVTTLTSQLRTRLLHLGATTQQLLTMFINLVKV